MSQPVSQTVTEHAVLPLAALPPGGQYVWQQGLQRVLVCRSPDGEVSAMLDLCPHARQPLSGGTVDTQAITCPKHGARFDLKTGAPLNAVCRRPLTMVPVSIRDAHIFIAVPAL